MKIPVVIVSRVRLFRDALAYHLTAADGRIEIVAAIEDVSGIQDVGARKQPCIVVVDATGGTSESVAAALASSVVRPEVVLVGVDPLPTAATGGASAWPRALSTRASVVDLLGTIREVVDGWGDEEQVDGPGGERSPRDPASPEASAAVAALTAREREVALLLQGGLSNKEIAGRLEIRPATVKNHVHKILVKLGVRRRGEAVAVMQVLRREGDAREDRSS
jgi:two-component system, NarL family, nitrate/nitrite response regulator NarL